MNPSTRQRVNPERLAGKIAIVTGGASGIGAASARRLAAEGAVVVIADLNAAGAEGLAAEIRGLGGQASGYGIDLRETGQIDGMIDMATKMYGGLDILFNNAAHVPTADSAVADMDIETWNAVLQVNLTAPMYASKLAIPHMLARGGGSIVHTSSAAGLVAEDTRSAYGATKSGLFSLSRSIAVQYGKQGVRSNVIAPGLIVTPAAENTFTPALRALLLEHHMTPRLGTPEDIAGAVAFLCSDDAAFITGHVLTVDGGFTAASSITPAFRRLKRTG